MFTPWRWLSFYFESWFFEKQNVSETWFSFDENRFEANYTEVSVDIDSNGFPVVILKEIGKIDFVILTESKACMGDDFNNFSSNYSGAWKKANGKRTKIKYNYNQLSK